MKKLFRISAFMLAILLFSGSAFLGNSAEAANDHATKSSTIEKAEDNSTSAKAMASALATGLAGIGGTIGMGLAISKASDAISRQPEAEGKIRSALMIGLVFIETVVIYALIVAILVIFVL